MDTLSSITHHILFIAILFVAGIIKARIKTKPIRQWAVGREFNRLLKKRFDEQGIEIPFPHVTLFIGQDKQGNLPPLNVSMKQDRST